MTKSQKTAFIRRFTNAETPSSACSDGLGDMVGAINVTIVRSRSLVDEIDDESIRVQSPDFADVLARGDPAERLEPPSDVVSAPKVGEMAAKPIVAVIAIPLHRC